MQSKYELKYLIHLYEVCKSLPKPLWVPSGRKGKLQTQNVSASSCGVSGYFNYWGWCKVLERGGRMQRQEVFITMWKNEKAEGTFSSHFSTRIEINQPPLKAHFHHLQTRDGSTAEERQRHSFPAEVWGGAGLQSWLGSLGHGLQQDGARDEEGDDDVSGIIHSEGLLSADEGSDAAEGKALLVT